MKTKVKWSAGGWCWTKRLAGWGPLVEEYEVGVTFAMERTRGLPS